MPVKNDAHAIPYQQLMDGHRPAWAVLLEALAAIRVFAAPFHVGRRSHSSSHILAQSTDQVMQKDKLERCLARFQRLCQPAVLLLPQSHAPVVLTFAVPCEPEGIQHDEQCASPLKGIVVLQHARAFLRL